MPYGTNPFRISIALTCIRFIGCINCDTIGWNESPNETSTWSREFRYNFRQMIEATDAWKGWETEMKFYLIKILEDMEEEFKWIISLGF